MHPTIALVASFITLKFLWSGIFTVLGFGTEVTCAVRGRGFGTLQCDSSVSTWAFFATIITIAFILVKLNKKGL